MKKPFFNSLCMLLFIAIPLIGKSHTTKILHFEQISGFITTNLPNNHHFLNDSFLPAKVDIQSTLGKQWGYEFVLESQIADGLFNQYNSTSQPSSTLGQHQVDVNQFHPVTKDSIAIDKLSVKKKVRYPILTIQLNQFNQYEKAVAEVQKLNLLFEREVYLMIDKSMKGIIYRVLVKGFDTHSEVFDFKRALAVLDY